MLKQQITYTDFDGNQVTEDHYFHLTRRQVMKLQAESGGDLGEQFKKAVERGDNAEILSMFENIVAKSYGIRRNVDGREKFDQSPEISAAFLESLAYDELFGRFIGSSKAVVDFVLGILPSEVAANPEVQKAAKEVQLADEIIQVPHTITQSDADRWSKMSAEELRAELQGKRS